MPQPPAGQGQTALITGASSGIGAALAQRFACGGFDLVLVARNAPALEALAASLRQAHGVRARVVVANLAEPEAAQRLAAALKRARRPVDVLVNNAGMLAQGSFASLAAPRHRALINLNVTALTELIAEFLPPMLRRGRGRVLNVASIAAFQPVPTLASYAASKAYVLSLTESLAEELKGSGVSVTALCPGITATPMLDHARDANAALGRLPGFVIGDVADVADEGYEACLNGEVIRVPGALNQAAMLAGRATPKWLLRRVSGALARGLRR